MEYKQFILSPRIRHLLSANYAILHNLYDQMIVLNNIILDYTYILIIIYSSICRGTICFIISAWVVHHCFFIYIILIQRTPKLFPAQKKNGNDVPE